VLEVDQHGFLLDASRQVAGLYHSVGQPPILPLPNVHICLSREKRPALVETIVMAVGVAAIESRACFGCPIVLMYNVVLESDVAACLSENEVF
jgi:hypothetical protein